MRTALWLLLLLAAFPGCTCTQPMIPDAGIDAPVLIDVGLPDVPALPDAPSDAPGVDGGTDAGRPGPGALSVVGGFGTLPVASGGALYVVGGFGAAPACNGSLCVYGGFSR